MNLSTHSISPQSARYSEKPSAGPADPGAGVESKAEFAEMFDHASERRDVERPRNGSPRDAVRAKSSREKAKPDKSRESSEKKAAAKHQPDENLISKTDVPTAQPADEVDSEDAELWQGAESAPAVGENDLVLGGEAGAAAENLEAVSPEGSAETFALPSSAAKGKASAPGAELVSTENDADEIAAAESVAAGEAMAVNREAGQEKPRNATALPAPKRGSAKSLENLDAKLAADFAESRTDVPAQPKRGGGDAAKNFLEPKEQEVTKHEEFLGINVANPGAAMKHDASTHELSSLLTKQLAAHEGAALSSFEPPVSSAAHEVVLSGIHRAINTVVEAGEKLRSIGSRAVDLQFSFGSDDLSVRVELHEGRVRATFRTDSAELRGALAQEWQVLNAAGVDRAKRFADPVFAANSSASAAGDHQEKQGGRKQDLAALKEHFEISNSPRVSVATSARTNAPAALPQTAAPLTALRLHTFA